MKNRFDLYLLKLSDPRVVQLLLLGAALALALFGHDNVVLAGCPAGGGGSCTGG